MAVDHNILGLTLRIPRPPRRGVQGHPVTRVEGAYAATSHRPEALGAASPEVRDMGSNIDLANLMDGIDRRYAASVATSVTYGRRVESVDEWIVRENNEAMDCMCCLE